MIFAFNFTCHRDRYLSELMETTLYKYCKEPVSLHVINTDTDAKYAGYGNGAGWPQGMMKVNYMRTMNFKDDDWVLSVDSDVVFCNGDVFKHLDTAYGIIGILGQQPWDTVYGKKNWAHMSGCLIFIRGDIAREICSWSDEAFDRIRFEQFKTCNITENEDVMLSYFAMIAKSQQRDISEFSGNNFEQDIISNYRIGLLSVGEIYGPKNHDMKSFYHLNYCPTKFMGYNVGGKWDIPHILNNLSISL